MIKNNKRATSTILAVLLLFIVLLSLSYPSRKNLSYAAVNRQTTSTPSPSYSVITPSNAHQVSLINELGRGWINSMVWSPDGATLALASSLGIWFYDFFDNTLASPVLLSEYGAVEHIDFHPNGSMIAFDRLYDDSTITVWDIDSDEEYRVLPIEEPDSYVESLAFSPDGTVLAAAISDRIILWNVNTSVQLPVLTIPDTWSNEVEFATNGGLLASANADGTVGVWDMETYEQLYVLEGHADSVRSVSFSEDGSMLASGGFDNTVRLWDMETATQIIVLEGHERIVSDVELIMEDSLLISKSYDDTVRIWDTSTGDVVVALASGGEARKIALHPNRHVLAFSKSNGVVSLWDIDSQETITTVEEHFDPIKGIAFSPVDSQLAVVYGGGSIGVDDNPVRLWDVASGVLLDEFRFSDQEGMYLTSIDFASNGNMLAVGYGSITSRAGVLLLNLADRSESDLAFYGSIVFGGIRATYLSDKDLLVVFNGVAYDSATLVSYSHVFVIDSTVPPERQIADMILSARVVGSQSDERFDVVIDPSNDSQIAYTNGIDNTVRILDLRTRSDTMSLAIETDEMVYLHAFSPDGRLLAISTSDGNLVLWDTINNISHNIVTNGGLFGEVNFNPDGSLFAVAVESSIQLWDTANFSLLSTLDHDGSLVEFSPDGRFIASGSRNGTIKFWGIE